MQDPIDESPAVSVIIPAFRAAGDIAAALDSVFAQTLPNIEVIVVNDASPDTPELERALTPYFSHIRYLVLPVNRGAAAARNAGIAVARARFLAFLDADDVWARNFLEMQVSFLEANEGCALVYADALISGETPLAGRRFMDTAPSDGDATLLALIEQRCNIILSTVVARRDAILAVGAFDEGIRRGQDFDLWLRLALRGTDIKYQRIVLAERRVRASGLSGEAASELERALSVLERFGNRHLLTAAARTSLRIRTMQLIDRLEIEQGKRRFIEGNFAAAQYHLSSTRDRPLRLRLALVALQFAPRLMRAVYLRVRRISVPPQWATSSR